VIVAAVAVSGGHLGLALPVPERPFLGAGTLGASFAAAGIMTAGMLLVNAIAPVKFWFISSFSGSIL